MNTTPNRRSHEDGGNGNGNVGSSGSHSHSSALKYPHEDHGTFSSVGWKVAASAKQEYHALYDMGQDARMPKIMPRNESRDVDRRLPLLPNMLFRVSSSSNESLSDHFVGSESRLEWRDSKDCDKDIKVENHDLIAEPRDLHQSGKGDNNVKHESRVDDSKDAKHESGDAFPEHDGDINLDKEGLNGSNSRLNWKDSKEHHGKQYPDASGGSVDPWRSSRTNLHGPIEGRKEVPNVEDRDFAEAHEAVRENNVDLKGDDKFKDKDRKRKEVKHRDWGERERERGDRRNNLQLENSSSENKEVVREDRESERWGNEKKDTAKDKEKLNDRAKDYVKREVLNGGETEASHSEKEPMDISGRSAERENLTLEQKKQKDHDNWKNFDRGTRDRKKEMDFDIEAERPDKRSRYHEKESEERGIDDEGSTERKIEAFNSGIQQQKRMLRPRGSPQMGNREPRFRSLTQDIEGMEYHLGEDLRQLTGKATWNSRLNSFRLIEELLDDHHVDMLRRSFIWPLRQLKEVQFSGQIIDALLCRLLKPTEGLPLEFDLGGKVAIFSTFDFSMITGLKITGDDHARKSNRLYETYFQGHRTVLLLQLLNAARGCDHMLDRLKLGLVYIVETVLRWHHKKTAIDLFHLEIVDDIDGFNNYTWGRKCYKDTVHAFTRTHSMPSGDVRKYDVYGLPLAVQIWAYETVPVLGTHYATRGETRCPRMLHWRSSRADGCPSGKQLSALLDDPHLEVITELTPSMEEESQGFVREIVGTHTQNEQMSDSILDRDWECDPVDRRSPPLRPSPPRQTSSHPSPSPLPRPSPSRQASPHPSPSPPPLASSPPLAPPSSTSRYLPHGSPVHGHSQFDDLYARLTGFITRQIDDLRRDLTGQIDDLRRDLTGRVDNLSHDIFVHIATLRGDIIAGRGGERGGEGDRGGDGERVTDSSGQIRI